LIEVNLYHFVSKWQLLEPPLVERRDGGQDPTAKPGRRHEEKVLMLTRWQIKT
jgi:hypothetical protein